MLQVVTNPFPALPFPSGLSGESSDGESYLMAMSTLQEAGLAAVKQTACDRLLNFRVELKVQVRDGVGQVLSRQNVTVAP